MSASLVGSEMCLRDSLTRNCKQTLTRGPVPMEPYADASTAQIADPAPVSYTHLTLPTICSV
eukprot:15240000-Alexandrium_andersonii.AAC.1